MEGAEDRATNGFNDWEHLFHHPPPSLPPPITTSNTSDHFLSIFPPTNHEDLPIHSPSPPDSHPNSNDLSSSFVEASSSRLRSSGHDLNDQSISHSSQSRSSSNSPAIRCRSNLTLRMLYIELQPIFFSLRRRVSLLKSQCCVSGCRGMIAATFLVAFGTWAWWWRRRRRSGLGVGGVSDKVEHLKQIIREKDEKIIELLNQIARLNKLLVARYTVPVVKGAAMND